MSTESKIKIIDKNSDEVLYTYSFSQSDEAYAMATDLEEMGLDIYVKVPTVTESLCDTLGLGHDQRAEFEQSVVAELDDHEGHEAEDHGNDDSTNKAETADDHESCCSTHPSKPSPKDEN